jgi:Tol biopolymer transport system component
MLKATAWIVASIALGFLQPVAAAATSSRLLTVQDIIAVREVSDPRLSPDGQWVAYVVRTADPVKDKHNSHLWMSSWDGKQSVQLTYSDKSENSPRWSPDSKYLAFLTARGEDDPPQQVWLLDRQGGEAKPLTGFNGDVVDFSWSPDGKKLALIVADEDPRKMQGADKDKTPPPIVIDRYYFKEDETGYLGSRRQHLYVFDVVTRKFESITPGRFSESRPSWSPDGTRIAFYSNRGEDPDRNNEFGLYTVEPRTGATPKLLTKFQGDASDSWMHPPAWRPDGREIAFITAGDPKLIFYSVHNLAVVSSAGGEARLVSKSLDRNVSDPQWSADGRSIYFLVEDDLNQVLSRINVASGKVERGSCRVRMMSCWRASSSLRWSQSRFPPKTARASAASS